MIINIPTIINELRENATEEQRRGLSILESRFYECIELKKENAELVQKIHILNEANMNLENTVGKLGEQLNEANKVVKFYADSFCGDKQEDGTYLICTRENALGRVDVTYNPNIANNYLEKWGVK